MCLSDGHGRVPLYEDIKDEDGIAVVGGSIMKKVQRLLKELTTQASIADIDDYSEKKHGVIVRGNKESGVTSGGYFVKGGLVNSHERLC